jgi:hypothetical protein
MPDPNQNQAPPQTLQLDQPATSAPASTPAPTGAGDPPQTLQLDQTSQDNQGPERGTMENLLGGFEKGAAKTVQGGMNLLGRGVELATGAPKGSLQATSQETEQPSTARDVGEFGENAAEFMTGDAILDAGLTKAMNLVKASKASPLLTETLKVAQKHPLIARMIEGGAKSAAVGGAQGAAKGAAEEQAGAGAEGGLIGGAVGGAAAELATPIARAVGEKLGIGTSAVKDAQEALRPSKSNRDFAIKFERAAPYLDEMNQTAPPATMEDWAKNADAARENLYQKKIEPLIAQHENYPLSSANIASRINAAVDPVMASQDPKEAALIHDQAVKMLNTTEPIKMGDAEKILQYYNKKVAATGYWSKPPAERVALMETDGNVAGLVATADAIRDEFYGTLKQIHPDADIRSLKADYGALAETGNTIRGRINVDARQSRVSLKEMLGLLTGAHLGGPMGIAAGAIPFVDRAVNSPSRMLGRAVAKAARPGETSAIAKGATKLAKGAGAAAPVVGAGLGRVAFTASNGSVHSVPAEHLAEAQRVDPTLQVHQ